MRLESKKKCAREKRKTWRPNAKLSSAPVPFGIMNNRSLLHTQVWQVFSVILWSVLDISARVGEGWRDVKCASPRMLGDFDGLGA